LNEKSELLQQLRLDRGTRPKRLQPVLAWAAAGTILGLVALALLLWWRPGTDPIAVRFAVARAADAAGTVATLDASGYVVARRQATVAAKITARVTEILIEEGQHVSGGQIMARLDDSNIHAALVQARAQLAQADANLAAVKVAFNDEKPIFSRQQELNRKGWVSGADFDSERARYDEAEQNVKVSERGLEVAQAALQVALRNQEDTLVRAPYEGVITVKAAQPGEVVSPLSAGGGFTRTGIGTLVDMDSLEVEVDVSENYIERARPGQDAVVRLNAYPDWPIPATVIAIIPTADRAKATVKVRVGFKQKDPRILPEMGARVSFLGEQVTATGAPAVLVPDSAVTHDSDQAAVFVVQGDHVLRQRVTLGSRQGDQQAILQGLAAGQTVASGDIGRLTDGALIRRRDRD